MKYIISIASAIVIVGAAVFSATPSRTITNVVSTNRFETNFWWTNVFYSTNTIRYVEMPDEVSLRANSSFMSVSNPTNAYLRTFGLRPVIRRLSAHEYEIEFEKVKP